MGTLGRAAVAVTAGAWVGYGWGAQCLLPLLAVRRGPAGKGEVSLTFDDGPDPRGTPPVLRELAGRGARATFFLIGERATRHPEIVRAIAAEGHEIGSHGLRHRNAWFLGPAATREEIVEGARRVADITGVLPRLYRPPWGIVNLAALLTVRRAGLRTILWSLQPEGLRQRDSGAQLRHCDRRLHDGAIVDLHDAPGLPGAPERLLAVLPGLLELLSSRGYTPVPVGRLLGGRALAPTRDLP
jgi:peptidoglycan/xylan/chitin deacetylase (PgdA/CDA1 family)